MNTSLPAVESPHLAIIHLLKAKGCCQSTQSTANTQQSDHLRNLRSIKTNLESRLQDLNSRMNNVPCSVKLEGEIYQLQSIIHGLRHENEMRKQEAGLYAEKANRTFQSSKTVSVRTDQRVSLQIEQELAEHRRLEQEYHGLLEQIRKIHQANQGIVNTYDQISSYSTSSSSY